MSTSKVLLILFCVLLSVSTFAANGKVSNTDENKLFALERMWNQAQLTHDSVALKSMLGDHFVNTEWDGVVSTRDEFLTEIADPKWSPETMSVEDMRVDFYGTAAVVVGVYRTKGRSHGKKYEHVGRFTDTWVRENANWKCVASHTSLMQK
jgi:ketosteroid isomerase-like protein